MTSSEPGCFVLHWPAPELHYARRVSALRPSQRDKEKEPHFFFGRENPSTLRHYKGAIDSFEKALKLNPKSASAHFELAWIFDQKESDPVAGYLPFRNHYLNLRAAGRNEETVRIAFWPAKRTLHDPSNLGPASQSHGKELGRYRREHACARNCKPAPTTNSNMPAGSPPLPASRKTPAPPTTGCHREAYYPDVWVGPSLRGLAHTYTYGENGGTLTFDMIRATIG